MQLEIIGKIAQLWCPTPSRILDLGCGNGILGRFLLNIFPSAHGLFVDFSDPMLDAARESMRPLAHTTITKADFGTPNWLDTDTVRSHKPFDIVVSGFAIHHQPDERKMAFYAAIQRHLFWRNFF